MIRIYCLVAINAIHFCFFFRKFQPKTDAKFAYDQIVDEDDEETTAHVIVPESHPTPNAEFSEPTSNEKIQNPLNKEIKAATHKRKFRKDLNL